MQDNLPPGVSHADIERTQGDTFERERIIAGEMAPLFVIMSAIWDRHEELKKGDWPEHAAMLHAAYDDMQRWIEDRVDAIMAERP